MANRNLIAGTRAVYGDRFVDAAGSVGSGMQGYNAGISPSTLASLASMKNTDTQVKAYLNSLNTEMDLLELSDAEQNSIKGYLNTQKNLYSQLATELTQVDAISPKYMELKNRMDSIKQSFVNLKSQTDKFKERKLQYLDDLENGRLSKGNKPDDYNAAGGVYGGGALLIDPNGGINVVTNGGEGLVRYADVKDPFLKDFKTADEILEQNSRLYTAGVPLDPSKEALLRNQLKSKLSQEGALESIVEDGLITNERLNVDIDAYSTREDAINDVAEMLLQGYRDSAAAGAEEKRVRKGENKPKGNSDTITNPEGTYLGYGRNADADKQNFKAQYDAALSRAVSGDPAGLALYDKDGNLLVEGSKSEERSVKWYSSTDSKKYQGRVPRGGVSEWMIRPYKYKKDDGKIYYGVQWRDRDGNWQILQPGDFEKELNGTAGVTQANTNTSTGGAAQFNQNQSN
jgi:hypothetical protein